LQENVAFRGTHRYASINAHFRLEQSRRDDLEALAYVLIYFLKGLPWANLQVEKKDRRKVIGEAKAQTSRIALTEGLPAEFATFLEQVQSLEFSEDPPYERYKKLFADCLKRHEVTYDYCYDWSDPKQIPDDIAIMPKNLSKTPTESPPKKRKGTALEQKEKTKRKKVTEKPTKPDVEIGDDAGNNYQPGKRKDSPNEISKKMVPRRKIPTRSQSNAVIEISSD